MELGIFLIEITPLILKYVGTIKKKQKNMYLNTKKKNGDNPLSLCY